MKYPYRVLSVTCGTCGAMMLSWPAIGSANAQVLPPEANNPAVRAAISACIGDAKKYCADVVPGEGRIVRCLVARKDDLTSNCRDSILKAKTALGR